MSARFGREGFGTSERSTVTLKNKELWKQFHELDTEMVITKSGRRMFPALTVQAVHLDPHSHYCIILEMIPVSNCRYKYSSSGGWAPSGIEEAESPKRVYLHPESPAKGDYWMSQPISFGRLKLTNTTSPPAGHLVLSSMHKYQPRVIIAKTSDPRSLPWAPSIFVDFPETQFIAVTAYQNEKITRLKINNNPFAKGFRDNGHSKCKRKSTEKLEEPPKKEARLEPEAVPEPAVPHKPSDVPTEPCGTFTSPCVYKSTFLSPGMPFYCCPQYQTGAIWGGPQYFYHPPPTFLQQGVFVPSMYCVPKAKPKKLTDFSIRAITGSS